MDDAPASDRRRFLRITPNRTVVAQAGSLKALLVDISMEGARIAHPEPIPVKTSLLFRFEWDGSEIAYICHVAWSERDEKSSARGKVMYHSGLELLDPLANSKSSLKQMITTHVERALDEQKSNAKGIPPLSTTFLRTAARATGYVRCELVLGTWKKTFTPENGQPRNGFTISAQESPEHIALLCQTYETADSEFRESIRRMAELSVSNPEGVATRKYEP